MLLAGLWLVGCSGSESTNTSPGEPKPKAPAEERAASAEPPEVADSGGWEGLKRVAGRYSNRLLIPHGAPPKHVVVRDLKRGDGPPLRDDDDFLVRYVSFTYEKAWAIEPYWRSPTTYTFGLGTYKKGWEVGLKGIRIGGMRELIVPSSMAYGDGARVYVVQPLKLR